MSSEVQFVVWSFECNATSAGKLTQKTFNGKSYFPATAPTEWLGDSRWIQYTPILMSSQVTPPLGSGQAFSSVGPAASSAAVDEVCPGWAPAP